MKYIFAGLFMIMASFCWGQDMQEGFEMLDKGQFAKAEAFFENILIDHPDNRTARLCYARAIGLNGQEAQATAIFRQLLEEYPSDFEIKLNFGESLLWNRQYDEAKLYYENLIKEDPKSFAAALGYANTLSNLKAYPEALEGINKAIDIDPDSPSARLSKKYILLGYGSVLTRDQAYLDAEKAVREVLDIFPDDFEARRALADIYINAEAFDKAEAIYKEMNGSASEKVTALNGLALIAHLKNKDRKALTISKQALRQSVAIKDSVLKVRTLERHVQSLIWNSKYKRARRPIDSLLGMDSNHKSGLALKAMLNTYMNDLREGLESYRSLLEIDSSSFDGNLGKANLEKALGRVPGALESAERTLEIYPNQKDAEKFKGDLLRAYAPVTNTEVRYSFDNGNNKAYSAGTRIQLPLSYRFSINGGYIFRETENTDLNQSAKTHVADLGLKYEFIPKIKFQLSTGVFAASSEERKSDQLQLKAGMVVEALKLQFLDFGYQREVQNFNVQLVNESIVQNHFYINYNLGTNFKLGWFAQYFHTSQNDNNSRNLFFTSLYYSFKAFPVIKSGINYQFISFGEDAGAIYFSPQRFNAVELFLDILRDNERIDPGQFSYALTAATGLQFIEDLDKQNTLRVRAELGYKFSERALLKAFGSYSDIASTTASGFAFTEFGLSFKWILCKEPAFGQ